MRNYIYPKNLKSKLRVAFWNVRDLAIIVVTGIFGVIIFTNTGAYFPLLCTAVFAVLSIITADEKTVFGYFMAGLKLLILEQQEYKWKGSKK